MVLVDRHVGGAIAGDGPRYGCEGVPDAGPAPALPRHALHLVRRRGRPEHEPSREAPPAQPARVVDLRVGPVALRLRGGGRTWGRALFAFFLNGGAVLSMDGLKC